MNGNKYKETLAEALMNDIEIVFDMQGEFFAPIGGDYESKNEVDVMVWILKNDEIFRFVRDLKFDEYVCPVYNSDDELEYYEKYI